MPRHARKAPNRPLALRRRTPRDVTTAVSPAPGRRAPWSGCRLVTGGSRVSAEVSRVAAETQSVQYRNRQVFVLSSVFSREISSRRGGGPPKAAADAEDRTHRRAHSLTSVEGNCRAARRCFLILKGAKRTLSAKRMGVTEAAGWAKESADRTGRHQDGSIYARRCNR